MGIRGAFEDLNICIAWQPLDVSIQKREVQRGRALGKRIALATKVLINAFRLVSRRTAVSLLGAD